MSRPIRVGFVMHAMQVAGAEVLVAETIRRLGKLIENHPKFPDRTNVVFVRVVERRLI